MKPKVWIFFLFMLICQTRVYSQNFEEVICWNVTEYDNTISKDSADAIILFFSGSTLKLLVLDSQKEKLVYDMDIQKLYLDQTVALDSTYVGMTSSITLLHNKTKIAEGRLYIDYSYMDDTPDIIRLYFPNNKKIYLCQAEKSEMRLDLLAVAIIGTKTKFGNEEAERRLQDIKNLANE